MLFELQRTERVRNALNRIRERMGKVIHRIDTPRIARPMMRHMGNTVDHGIAHDEIRRRHVDLGAQNACSVRKLTRTHTREEIQILLDRAPAARTFLARLGQRTAIGPDLLRREIIHIGKPLLNQLDCIFIQPLEIVRGIEPPIAPREAEPADVLLNGIHILDVLLRRVRIVKAQIAETIVILSNTEVKADGLCVSDVQIAVRLGRKPRMDPLRMSSRTQIFVDDISDKI